MEVRPQLAVAYIIALLCDASLVEGFNQQFCRHRQLTLLLLNLVSLARIQLNQQKEQGYGCKTFPTKR